jgi:hypothetical protein
MTRYSKILLFVIGLHFFIGLGSVRADEPESCGSGLIGPEAMKQYVLTSPDLSFINLAWASAYPTGSKTNGSRQAGTYLSDLCNGSWRGGGSGVSGMIFNGYSIPSTGIVDSGFCIHDFPGGDMGMDVYWASNYTTYSKVTVNATISGWSPDEDDILCPGSSACSEPFIYTWFMPADGTEYECWRNGGCQEELLMEDGVSCGPPPSTDPEHCTNLEKDEDEAGIDCGGSCSAVCDKFCPPGTELAAYTGSYPGWPSEACFYIGLANDAGGCPTGYVLGSVLYPENPELSNTCGAVGDYILAAETMTNEDLEESFTWQPPLDPWDTIPTPTSEELIDRIIENNPDGSTTETTTANKTTTNPDGSKTVTTTTTATTTNPDGSSSTTTTTKKSTSDADGKGTTTTTTRTEIYDPDGNLESSSESGEEEGGPVAESDYKGDAVGWSDKFDGLGDILQARFDLMQERIKETGVFGALGQLENAASGLGSGSSSISINFGSYGVKSVDLTVMDDALAIWRLLLYCVMSIVTIRIIFLKG